MPSSHINVGHFIISCTFNNLAGQVNGLLQQEFHWLYGKVVEKPVWTVAELENFQQGGQGGTRGHLGVAHEPKCV